jgi:hypothetical protein
VAGRRGGEEFAIPLPGAAAGQGQRRRRTGGDHITATPFAVDAQRGDLLRAPPHHLGRMAMLNESRPPSTTWSRLPTPRQQEGHLARLPSSLCALVVTWAQFLFRIGGRIRASASTDTPGGRAGFSSHGCPANATRPGKRSHAGRVISPWPARGQAANPPGTCPRTTRQLRASRSHAGKPDTGRLSRDFRATRRLVRTVLTKPNGRLLRDFRTACDRN